MFHWTVYLRGGPKSFGNAAVAAGHKVYSFGSFRYGETYMNSTDQIEVHIFNTVSLRWRQLPPVTTGRAERPIEVPSMRDNHTAVLAEDVIYIWGGDTYTGEKCNRLYVFDVGTHEWLKPEDSGAVPGARCNHSACVLGKVMYIFGGFNLLTGCTTNDIYKLDTATLVWSLINITRGTQAPVSKCHSATIIGTKMFVFGGQKNNYFHHKKIRVFDTETNRWLSTPSTQILPHSRWGHSAFAYNGELYIFGGENSHLIRIFNDLWKFNPESFSWKKMEPKGKYPGSMSRMCCCLVGNLIILFAGHGTYDDLYILDLGPSLNTLCKLVVIQYDLEQSGLPHDIRWELAAMSTISNRQNNSPPKTNKTGSNNGVSSLCSQYWKASLDPFITPYLGRLTPLMTTEIGRDVPGVQ